jgi:tetratricopeptide (TPR) repeat protein
MKIVLTRCCLSLVAAIVISSVLTTAAQTNYAGTTPERGPAVQPAVVSTNQLRAPRAAQTAVHHAREALERRRYSEAKKHIERALEIYPGYAWALQLRGLLNLREQHLEEACADFEQAIQLDPNFGAPYLSLGAAYNRLGHFQEAVLPLSRAAAILPNAWTVQYELALAYAGTGKYEAALEAISRAEKNNPDEPDNQSSVSYTRAYLLLELKDYAAAKAAFEQSIRQDPQGHFAKLSQERLERLGTDSNEK